MARQVDLLKGNILRSLTLLALPIMGSQLVQMAYNLIDMIWIGRVGAGAVAAVGAAGMFMWLSNGMAVLPRMGGQVKVAQSIGAGNIEAAGRYAAAALQMGGDIGWQTGKLLRLSEHSCRTATLCGMAAFFTALFGTPLAATLFAMMVVNVGLVFYATFLPALASSLVAYAISLALGVPPTRYTVAAPGWDLFTAARTAGLGLACALVTLLFCGVMHLAHRLLAKYLPNPWLRALAGGVAVIALTLLCGSMRYNGAGGDVIAQAVEQGQALPLDFLFKILFTALTLGAGYKGGEVVPSFFVGATFGCVAAPLLGLPAGFGAALGLAAVFCGATNCLVPSIVLAVELFGAPGLLYYAIACGISYALSGYTGLYSHQTFLTDKLMPEYRAEIHPHHARAPQPGAAGESGEHQAP